MAACVSFVSSVPAAVVVVANFTPDDIAFTIREPDQKPRDIKIAPAQVLPVTVAGPAEITFVARPKNATLRLDPYNAFVFLPDEKAGRRLEGIELPGRAPEVDARAELNPVPRVPPKIPVTLLVDDADPRTEAAWQKALRARFDAAAAVIEAQGGIHLEFAGFDTWKSDPALNDVHALRIDFEEKVQVKPGHLAIGYTSRRVNESEREPAPFGECRPLPTGHILMREWKPRAEAEKVEALTQQLGLALGAVLCPDPGSVMRPTAGSDGHALFQQYQMRFDPLNALAMNIWAEERRRGPILKVSVISPENKTRLARIYSALLKTRPGDPFARTYLNDLDRADIVRAPDAVDPMAKKSPSANRSAREVVACFVVRAVTVQARANIGREALTGDALTAAYVQTAAEAAARIPGIEPNTRVAGFLIGLGVALDETDTLRNAPLTQSVVRLVESDDERDARIAVLGNPTLHGRRDLCRGFALGCLTGELHGRTRAEDVAIERTLSPTSSQRPAGISFAVLAAEFGGIAFVKRVRDNSDQLNQLARRFDATHWVPNTDGLRDGLSAERFNDDYGNASDPRFQTAIADIHARVKRIAGTAR